MYRLFILITLALQMILTTSAVNAQPSHIVVSKPVTDHDFSSEFIGIDGGFVYTFHILKDKKDKIGMIDVWKHDDMQFVRSVPISVEMDHVKQYVFLGGMMAGGEPVVFLFIFNSSDDTRAILMVNLDPLTGAVRKQSTLLSVPGHKFDPALRNDEPGFVYNSFTGSAALTLQEMHHTRQVTKKLVKVAWVDRNGKVSGPVDVELPVERFATIRNMALTGNGQVVLVCQDVDDSGLKYSRFITVADVVKKTSKTFDNLTGKDQGGVIGPRNYDILESQSDGNVIFFQPFTKKGVPDYGLSGILTNVVDASGQTMTTKLLELKVRDIAKHDTKQVPYLVDVNLREQWKANDGTWMFLLRRVGLKDIIIASADTSGAINHTWFYPLEQNVVFVKNQNNNVIAIPDDKACWFVMSELTLNVGKSPGTLVPTTNTLLWKGQVQPCMVRFDGNEFGKLEAIPGITDAYYTFKVLQNNTGNGRRLIEWLNLKQVAFMEIGR